MEQEGALFILKEDVMVEFKKGDHIPLAAMGYSATVVKKLGGGAQGIVYEVSINGKSYALKWYTDSMILSNRAFKDNLTKNINERGSPDARFLWPYYLTEVKDGSYGYIMDVKPQRFSKFPGILNNVRKFPSRDVLLVAALNLVSAFRALHKKGLSYQDINDGSLFIDVKTGDVLICDCDNVSPGGEGNKARIKGTEGYWAPEIVTGKAAHPSTETDRHSLAVALFKLLVRQHPLYGKKIAEGDGIPDIKVMEGTNPVFMFDPKDKSNRPDLPELKNAPKNWAVLPHYVQSLFERVFGEGLREPAKRPSDLEWQQGLIKFRDDYLGSLNCPKCTTGELSDSKVSHLFCKKCGESFDQPARLKCGDYLIPMLPGKKIYGYHLEGKTDMLTADSMTVAGEVVASRKEAGLLGIKNLSKDTWMYTAPNGESGKVMYDNVMDIKCGTDLTLKGITSQVVFQLSTGRFTIPLYPKQKVKIHETAIAEVVASKHNPHKWGLKNLSNDVWSFTSAWGEQGEVNHDDVMSLGRGCVINFGSMSGKITG